MDQACRALLLLVWLPPLGGCAFVELHGQEREFYGATVQVNQNFLRVPPAQPLGLSASAHGTARESVYPPVTTPVS